MTTDRPDAMSMRYRPQPMPLAIGVHYTVQPNAPRCIFRDHRGNQCQRVAHSHGAHVV
jgi:hypothetical protein